MTGEEGVDLTRAVLLSLRLKGRAKAAAVGIAVGANEKKAMVALAALSRRGLVEETSTGHKLTDAGRVASDEARADERANVDRAAIESLYERFCVLNLTFKDVVTSWQLKSAAELNDHSDAAYDAAVLHQFAELHERFLPLMTQVVAVLPRLGTYPTRFAAAASAVAAGDLAALASPSVDSYHTIWFELHEELIQISGKTRADEAAAGRA